MHQVYGSQTNFRPAEEAVYELPLFHLLRCGQEYLCEQGCQRTRYNRASTYEHKVIVHG
jgi:hypothetical protein